LTITLTLNKTIPGPVKYNDKDKRIFVGLSIETGLEVWMTINPSLNGNQTFKTKPQFYTSEKGSSVTSAPRVDTRSLAEGLTRYGWQRQSQELWFKRWQSSYDDRKAAKLKEKAKRESKTAPESKKMTGKVQLQEEKVPEQEKALEQEKGLEQEKDATSQVPLKIFLDTTVELNEAMLATISVALGDLLGLKTPPSYEFLKDMRSFMEFETFDDEVPLAESQALLGCFEQALKKKKMEIKFGEKKDELLKRPTVGPSDLDIEQVSAAPGVKGCGQSQPGTSTSVSTKPQ
jgi:hypothetical protein